MKKKIRWPLYVCAALIDTFGICSALAFLYIEVPGGSRYIRSPLKVNDRR